MTPLGPVHAGRITYIKRRKRWVGNCECGFYVLGLTNDSEHMVRANLDLHLNHHKPTTGRTAK